MFLTNQQKVIFGKKNSLKSFPGKAEKGTIHNSLEGCVDKGKVCLVKEERELKQIPVPMGGH